MYECSFPFPDTLRLSILQYWMETTVQMVITAAKKDGLEISEGDLFYKKGELNEFDVPFYTVYYEPPKEGKSSDTDYTKLYTGPVYKT